MKLFSTIVATATVASLAVATAVTLRNAGQHGTANFPAPETVSVRAGEISYRLPGEYLAGDRPTDAPEQRLSFGRDFEMMKYQVSAADYARCVAAKACKPADGRQDSGTLPVTGVDHQDATDYARWLSKQTGEQWRLPTDAEWTFAAAERFREDPLGLADDGSNPATRWIARYRKESANAAPDPEPKPQGYFGTNSKGIADMSGNVWDWTSTCYKRAVVESDGNLGQGVENCGVRVAAGKHRAYMSFFIRDGKSGGCAAGMAPHNLGIRLVREHPSLLVKLKAALLRLVG